MGWDKVGREKNKPSERVAMKWRAGKARCMAITTTCVSIVPKMIMKCTVYVSDIVAWAAVNSRETKPHCRSGMNICFKG